VSSPPRGELASKLAPVVLDAVRSVGFDLEQLDVRQAGRRRVVRVIVDSDHGVGLDEIAAASRAVSAALDERGDLLAGPYTLEVTSPGVDRPLTKPHHWRRARLRLVRVQLTDGGELLGRTGDADDDGVVLLVEGSLRRLAYRDVARATVEIEFKQPAAAEMTILEQGARTTSDEPTIGGSESDQHSEEESK
jgi:ribosome maturation factor RimP